MISAGDCSLLHMLDPRNYFFTIHAVLSIFVGSATAVLGIYVLIRERGSRISVIFWFLTACAGLWLVGFGLAYACLRPEPALCWVKLAEAGVTFIPAGVLALTVGISGRTRQYGGLTRAGFAASALFCTGAAATSLHVKGLYRYFWGYYPEFGPLGAVFFIYFLGVMIFILRLYRAEYRGTADIRRKKRMKGMLTAFSIAYLASLDFVAAFGVSLYPFGYAPMSVFIALTAFVILRYRLVDLTPELAAGRVFEAMRGAVIVADVDGKIRVANNRASQITGYSSAELLGADLGSVINLPDDIKNRAPFRSEDAHDHAVSWVNKEGRRLDLLISTAPLMDRDRTPAGVAYILDDVTERMRAGQKLKQYADDLKQSNEDVLSFAYIVSHDLRAPLVSIKGFTGELQHAVQQMDGVIEKCLAHLDEKERKEVDTLMRKDVPEAMEFIDLSVKRMDGMIASILTLSRLGRRELKMEPVDMKSVTHGILNSLAHQIEAKQVRALVGDLPCILADRMSMEQVMGNLLDNALKYLESGRPGLLEITAVPQDAETVFRVKDNGRGIVQDDLQKVFQLFRRAGKQDVPGEGMGLAYVKTIVKRHNGRIWCESEPGKGSVFCFTIPHASQHI